MNSNDSLKDRVLGFGFAFLPSYQPERPAATVSSSVGKIVRLPNIDEVQSLVPRLQEEASLNKYSGNYGHTPFPLHTDLAHWYMPPRFLLLRCVEGSMEVATRLLDGDQMMRNFGRETLYRTLVQPRRPINFTRPILRLVQEIDQSLMIRWDKLFLVPATPKSAAIFEQIEEYLRIASYEEFLLSSPGDTLIIDNWRILHGRGAIPSNATNRRIERTYLEELN